VEGSFAHHLLVDRNEIDDNQACYITYNGYVQPFSKRMRPGDLAYRCVCEPGKLNHASLSPPADR
jgi:hypothetical protein